MLTNLRQAWYLIGRDQWARWAVLVVFALLATAFEMIGAVLVFVLVGLVADPNGEIVLPIVGDLRALTGGMTERELLLWFVAGIAVFFVVRGVIQVGNVYVQGRVAMNMGARLSNKLVEGYIRWPYEVHLNRTSAELIRNGHQAVLQLVGQVFLPLIRISAELFLTIGVLLILVSFAPAATGIAIVVVGGAATLVLLVVQPRLKELGRSAHQMEKDTLATLQQSLHGIRDIKVLGRERFFARRYARSRLRLARSQYLRNTLRRIPSTIMEIALMSFILLFFGVTIAVGDDATAILPALALFAYAGLRLQPSIARIVAGINNLKYSSAPLNDLCADLRAVESIPSSVRDAKPLSLEKEVVLEDVSFRYEGADRDALADVNLVIHVGEQIGVCGPTGGGKTTIADIITGLLEPTSGRVMVDGRDVGEQTRAWQRNLGVVSQVVFLVDDTLERNIALGVDDLKIDQEALDEAISLAQLSEFIDELPDGLATRVGERGIRLSGGQRQRIAIARALYRRPEVLIFDEGTSALDNVTEARLMKSIERLRGEHTIILIAHRLSTVRDSDRVVFIEHGQITGADRYDVLYEKNEGFRTMAGE